MMRRDDFSSLLRVCALTLFVLILLPLGFAQDAVPEPEGYVIDEAGILTLIESQLESQLEKLENDITVEIAILTIDSLEGEPIDNYAQQIFDQWEIGQSERDNGLLLLISVQDREWRIHTGYGVEGTIPDITASRIGNDKLVPHFKRGDYASGVKAAVDELELLLRKDPSVVARYEEDQRSLFGPKSEILGLGLEVLKVNAILLFLIFIKIIYSAWKATQKKNPVVEATPVVIPEPISSSSSAITPTPEKASNLQGVSLFFTAFIAIFLSLALGFMGLFATIGIGILTSIVFGVSYGMTFTLVAYLIILLFVKMPVFGGFTSTSSGNSSHTYSNRNRYFSRTSSSSSSRSSFGGGRSGGGGSSGRW